MSAGSVRIHVPVDLHQHEDPPDESRRVAIPDGRGEDDCCGNLPHSAGRLWREDGKVMFQDGVGGQPQAARVVWTRPLSERDGPVSIMMAEKKRELAFLPTLDVLPEESRRVALEELSAGAVLPIINEIHRVRPRFGNYYWDVETNMGRKTFLLASPETNTYRPRPDVIVVKDVAGNCYEISSVSGLSGSSRREMDRVL